MLSYKDKLQHTKYLFMLTIVALIIWVQAVTSSMQDTGHIDYGKIIDDHYSETIVTTSDGYNLSCWHGIPDDTDTPSNTVFIFLLGYGNFLELCLETLEAFRQKGEVKTMIQRGHGRSIEHNPHIPVEHTIDGKILPQIDTPDTYITDAYKFLTDYALVDTEGKKRILCGFSMGGHIAVRLLQDYPRLRPVFYSAILLSPLINSKPFEYTLFRTVIRCFGGYLDYIHQFNSSDKAFRLPDGTPSSQDGIDRHHLIERTYPQRVMGAPSYDYVYKMLLSIDQLYKKLPLLESLKTKLMLVRGRHDHVISHDSLDLLYKTWGSLSSSASLLLDINVPHAIPFSDPKQLKLMWDAVWAFCAH